MALKRVFLVGCPRSGTTLLQAAVGSSDAIYTLPETHVFRSGIGRGALRSIAYLRRKPLLKRLSTETRTSYASSYIDEVVYTFSTSAYIRRVIETLDLAAHREGKDGWLEKTPEHLFSIEHICRACPDVLFVHILRDGHRVIPSIVDMWNQFTRQWRWSRKALMVLNDLRITCKMILRDPAIFSLLTLRELRGDLRLIRAGTLWRDSVVETERFVTHPNHFVCQYENLVKEPEAVLRGLCKFLDIKYDAKMMQTGSIASRITTREETWKAENFKNIGPVQSSKYESLNDHQRCLVEYFVEHLN